MHVYQPITRSSKTSLLIVWFAFRPEETPPGRLSFSEMLKKGGRMVALFLFIATQEEPMSNRHRLHVRISQGNHKALKSYAESQNTTMSEVVDAALHDYFSPEEYKTASLRFLTNLSRKLDVVLSREEAILETVGRFTLIYLLHTPPIPTHEKKAAHTEGKTRWEQFMTQLSKSLEGNETVLSLFEKTTPDSMRFYFSKDEQ